MPSDARRSQPAGSARPSGSRPWYRQGACTTATRTHQWPRRPPRAPTSPPPRTSPARHRSSANPRRPPDCPATDLADESTSLALGEPRGERREIGDRPLCQSVRRSGRLTGDNSHETQGHSERKEPQHLRLSLRSRGSRCQPLDRAIYDPRRHSPARSDVPGLTTLPPEPLRARCARSPLRSRVARS